MTTPSPLRLQRLAAGLRIADVALETGITETRVSEIERGEGRRDVDTEVRIIQEMLARHRP
jgi:transcriptional regulator with XRE-family HTH domain